MGNDDRFSDVKKDPKFKRVQKRQNKVELDQRFISMFTSDKFQSKTNVDKFGRPLGSSSTVDLMEYYRLTSINLIKTGTDNEKSTKNLCYLYIWH